MKIKNQAEIGSWPQAIYMYIVESQAFYEEKRKRTESEISETIW